MQTTIFETYPIRRKQEKRTSSNMTFTPKNTDTPPGAISKETNK